MRELDYQRPPIPSSNIDSHISLLKPLDFREIPPVRQTQTKFYDLSTDTQHRLLTDINQELIDNEVRDIVTELTGQTITNKVNPRSFLLSTDLKDNYSCSVTKRSENERRNK